MQSNHFYNKTNRSKSQNITGKMLFGKNWDNIYENVRLVPDCSDSVTV